MSAESLGPGPALTRELVSLDRRRHRGPVRMVAEDALLDLVVVEETEVAVGALVGIPVAVMQSNRRR